MSTFKVQYGGYIVPKEVTTLSDGNDTVTTINSNIDKTFGGKMESSFGTSAENVTSEEILTTANYVDIDTIFSAYPQGIYLLFIRIVSAGAGSTPDVVVSLDGGAGGHLYLAGVGDFMIARVNGLSGLEVAVKSSNVNTLANIEIFIAGT